MRDEFVVRDEDVVRLAHQKSGKEAGSGPKVCRVTACVWALDSAFGVFGELMLRETAHQGDVTTSRVWWRYRETPLRER